MVNFLVMKKIMLHGRNARKLQSKGIVPETLVDDDVWEWASKVRWGLIKNKLYIVRGQTIKRKLQPTKLLHREIMGLQYGDRRQVDHIDGNPLNNQRSNLRIASRIENTRYQKKMLTKAGRPTSSRYKGVSWDAKRHRWQARFGLKGKTLHLGRFAIEEDAARAYDKKVTEVYGEFAKTNVMLGLLPPITPR